MGRLVLKSTFRHDAACERPKRLAGFNHRGSGMKARSACRWMLLSVICCLSVPVMANGSLQGLGSLSTTSFYSSASDITPDAGTVLGQTSIDGSWRRQAFVWTPVGGMVSILPSSDPASKITETFPQAISNDGITVVGQLYDGAIFQAFRWTASSGIVRMPMTAATDVSADGSVIVGFGAGKAIRWTAAAGAVQLGTLGGAAAYANGVNADGSVVVGDSQDSSGVDQAFRWTQSGGMVSLGTMGGKSSQAWRVNTDGSVVVGSVQNSSGFNQAFRWTQSGGMVGLGTLGGNNSNAWNVSGNGLVVVGDAQDSSGTTQAFRWSAVTGMQSVSQWLGTAGVNATGWVFTGAGAANADGSVLVGKGTNPSGDTEAWLARVSPLGSGLMNPLAFNASLGSAQDVGRVAESLIRLPLDGAHHRPLMAYDFGTNACGWATVDGAQYNKEKNAGAMTAEMGSCLDYQEHRLRLGIAAGYGTLGQDLAMGSKNELDGYYALLEADYRIGERFIASLLAMQGSWDVKAVRSYVNASALDFSFGKTDAVESAVRARIDWIDAFRMGDVRVSPRFAYTWMDSRIAQYSEVGGGFPVYFSGQDHSTDEARLGIDTDWPVGSHTLLRGMVEAVHRMDGENPALNGQVIGLYRFSVPAQGTPHDWGRLGFEVEHHLSRSSLLSISLNGSSRGEDPDLSGAISFRMGF